MTTEYLDSTQVDDRLQLDKQRKPKLSFFSIIKWSSVTAFLTAYTHFVGFSFIKGMIEGSGFHASNIDVGVNETLHQAAAATAVGIIEVASFLFKKEMFHTAIILAASFTFAVIFFKCIESVKANFFNFKEISKRATIRIGAISIFSAVMGFITPYAIAYIIVVTIGVGWFGLTVGEHLGQTQVERLISTGVCREVAWESYKKDTAISCTSITLKDRSSLKGRHIYEDANQIFFITNFGAYQLDKDFNLKSYVCFHRRSPEKFFQTESPHCVASCDPGCKNSPSK